MLMIILTFALFPIQVGQLGELIKRQDKYSGAVYKRKRRQEHVVLCGEVTADSLRYFLREIFHNNQSVHVSTVVVLCPTKPDTAIETVLLHPLYETRVKWLEGSAMLDLDLHRAEVGTVASLL
jgi:potassium large conductance calcium-activated channel subfamily M alpha protein 1